MRPSKREDYEMTQPHQTPTEGWADLLYLTSEMSPALDRLSEECQTESLVGILSSKVENKTVWDKVRSRMQHGSRMAGWRRPQQKLTPVRARSSRGVGTRVGTRVRGSGPSDSGSTGRLVVNIQQPRNEGSVSTVVMSYNEAYDMPL